MSGSTFRYEFVILDLSLRRYIEDVVESDSFKNAFFSVLMKNKKLCDKYLQIAALDRPFRGCAHVVSPVSLHLPGDCAPVFALAIDAKLSRFSIPFSMMRRFS